MMNLTSKSVTERMNKDMLGACEALNITNWGDLKARVLNEIESFTLTVKWLKEMRDKNEMNAEQARIHIDIHKNTMRTRLMSMPGVDMLTAENMLNTGIDAIRKEIYDYVGWVLV